MEAFYLSAYALRASDLTAQKKIDVSQIGRRLKLVQTKGITRSDLLKAHDLFINGGMGGKRTCVLADGGMMLLKGDLFLDPVPASSVMMQAEDMDIEQLGIWMQELLKPDCPIINKAGTIAYAPAMVAEIIAATDRQSFTWLCCRWN